jgi:hypothetical protein
MICPAILSLFGQPYKPSITNRNRDLLSEMLRKIIRRRQEIAKETVNRPLFEGSGYLHFCKKKVDVEFTAQMAPSGPIWHKGDVEVHVESKWVSQNTSNEDVN